MNKKQALLPILVPILLFSAFRPPEAGFRLVDGRAEKRVRALYANLLALSGRGILFGQEDALAYGVGWRAEPGRCDVREVCGEYPAVYGWDVSKLGKYPFNIDTVDFEQMKGWIREAYRMGGVNTISWHLDNPVSGGDSWDRVPAVPAILPGGEHHEWYKNKLDLFAGYARDLRSGGLFGHRIPIIFRPFHEHSGSWFWWGKDHCTPEEYKALWRFTVHYLRDEKGVHNLLYAYSPDIIESREEYLERYPGDEYVDILGLDNYGDLRDAERAKNLTRRLRMVAELAQERGKVAALTETGLNMIPVADWWTEVLLKNILADPVAARIAYLLVWRNARPDHHFGPFPGHGSAANFVEFTRRPEVWMAGDLPKLYRKAAEKKMK